MARPKADGSPVFGDPDIDLFHAWLFRHTNPDGKLMLKQGEIAVWAQKDQSRLSRWMSKMSDEGRLLKMASRWYVVDPAIWRWTARIPTTVTRSAVRRPKPKIGGPRGGYDHIRPEWRISTSSSR